MGREYYLPRPPQWQPERLAPNDHSFDNSGAGANANASMTRYHHHDQPSDMSRPMSIERALREQCRIPAQFYFVSAILDNGETVTFSGPTEYKEQIPEFFNISRWVRCATGEPSPDFMDDEAAYEDHYAHPRARSRQMQSQGPGQFGSQGMGQPSTLDYEGRRGYERRRAPNLDDPDEDAYRNRKRARAAGSRRAAEMPIDRPLRTVQPAPVKLPIRINEEERIWHIYDLRFRGLQQTACKLIAKAWVKLVEPKKQSTHPYTGSDEKAPDWWPKPWGTTRDEKVRHKEPDHLYKKERVHLLKHILRMIVLPNAEQHPDIQKLNLNVAKLEEATNEVLSSFFVDKDAPNNAKKRPYLKEIFLLARNEERYRNGEIDGTTTVYVMSEDKIPDNYQSENEEGSPAKDEEDNAMRLPTTISPRRSVAQTIIAPARSSAAAMPISAPVSSHGSTHSPGGDIPHGASQSFMSDLPHRNHPTYPPAPLMHPDISSDHHTGYVDNSGMSVGSGPSLAEGHGGVGLQQLVTSQPHEGSRRSSLFSPTAEFSSAPAPSTVYQTWPQGSNAPSASSMYTFPPAAAPPPAPAQHGSFVAQSSVAMPAQGHGGYMGYDPLPRNTYDSSHDTMFRQGAVPPPGTVNPQGGYSMQLPPHDTRNLSSHGLKMESNNRAHMH